MKIAYLIIAHGSREEEANQGFSKFLQSFRKIFPDRMVQGAFLELAKPNIAEAIETCIEDGATEIILMPLMFFPGRHVKIDIPQFIEEAKSHHPEVDFHYTGAISDHPMMLALLEDKGKQVLRTASHNKIARK
jgi:sirohydrochlorin cobaltochelatase